MFVPPVAAVWLWRSRRLHVAVKVALTVLCVLGTFFWIGVMTGPPKKDRPVAAPTVAPMTTAATPVPAPTLAPTETPAPDPSPVATEAPRQTLMPEVGGHTAVEARTLLIAAGLTADRIHEVSRYQDLALPADHGSWLACTSELPQGSPLDPGTEATLRLVQPGNSCPADRQQALYADPRNDPAAPGNQGGSTGGGAPTGTGGSSGGTSGGTGSTGGTTGGTSGGGSSGSATGGDGGGTGGGSVYFRNCADAKAAGKAPLHRGDPGYRTGLDRDNDGVACER